jgi:hypothetical protein
MSETTTDLTGRALAAWGERRGGERAKEQQQADALAERAAAYTERLLDFRPGPGQIEATHHRARIRIDDFELEYREPMQRNHRTPELWLVNRCRRDACDREAPFGPIRDLADLGRLLMARMSEHRRDCDRCRDAWDEESGSRLLEALRDFVDEHLAEQSE